MAKHEKSLIKVSYALTRFDPSARKELVVRGLNALSEVKDADFYFFKGEEYRMQGKIKEAISCYEKALQIDPEHEDALFWTGYCYSPKAEGRTDDEMELDDTIRNEKAASSFQKLIDIRKKKNGIGWSSYVVYYNLGLAQYYLELYKEAAESFWWAHFLCNLYICKLYEECVSYEEKEAIESSEQMTKLRSDLADAYHMCGCAQYSSDLYEEAIESFKQAIELKPDHANSYYMLGCAQYNLDLYLEAIESFKQAIELKPDDADSYYMLGHAQYKLDLYEEAIKNYKIYLRLEDHESPENQKLIAFANDRIEELKKMIQESKKKTFITYDFDGKIRKWTTESKKQ